MTEPESHMCAKLYAKILTQVEGGILKDAERVKDEWWLTGLPTMGTNRYDIHLFRRGESTCHPLFWQMAQAARDMADRLNKRQKASHVRLLLATNGLNFSADTLPRYEMFDFLNVSWTPDIDEFLLKELLKGHSKEIQVSLVRTTQSDAVIKQFKKKWLDLGADRVRIYAMHSQDGKPGSLPSCIRPRKPCVKPFMEMLINAGGQVSRCNHDFLSPQNGTTMGNANDNTIEEIWNGEKLNELRRQQQTLEITDPVCKECASWYPGDGEQGTGEVEDGE